MAKHEFTWKLSCTLDSEELEEALHMLEKLTGELCFLENGWSGFMAMRSAMFDLLREATDDLEAEIADGLE